MSATTPSTSPYTDTQVVRVQGTDARAFLHAQLTQDIRKLGEDRATLAAWLDAKGRVLTVLEVIPDAADWLLVLPADLAEATCARLRRFVLRADVRLEIDAGIAVAAIVGEATYWLADRGIAVAGAPWSIARRDAVALVRLGPALIQAIGPAAALAALLDDLPVAGPSAAALAEIALGLPRVGAAVSERYIPHMLGLDRLGAISFDKGCYPGQEIVARTQNLGSVKRRLARFAAATGPLPAPGTVLSDPTGEPAGEVVRAAASGAAGVELLAVVRIDSTGLRLATESGELEQLERLGLPTD